MLPEFLTMVAAVCSGYSGAEHESCYGKYVKCFDKKHESERKRKEDCVFRKDKRSGTQCAIDSGGEYLSDEKIGSGCIAGAK